MISSRCGLSYAGAKGSSAGRAPSRGEGRERSCLLSRTFPSDCKTFLGGGLAISPTHRWPREWVRRPRDRRKLWEGAGSSRSPSRFSRASAPRVLHSDFSCLKIQKTLPYKINTKNIALRYQKNIKYNLQHVVPAHYFPPQCTLLVPGPLRPAGALRAGRSFSTACTNFSRDEMFGLGAGKPIPEAVG